MAKKIKALLFAIALSGSALAGAGTITYTVENPATKTGSFTHSFDAKADSFVDTYLFSIATGYNFDLTSVVNSTKFRGTKDLDITGFSLSGPSSYLYTTSSALPSTTGDLEHREMTLNGLLGGTYTLTVNGKNAQKESFYNGSLNISNIALVSAVPEPESYAMMLAGLGFVGFIGRRRQKMAPSVFA